ncbi:ABC transporter permease [Marinithermus hydrothermalis]|uniref:Xylose transport system permease protein XylH n=1 Tax=Marinithermus hydrothermalis (strain DSM 14884 / JCM 11576 / T1) TaxID=869210 RepID=F2NKJ3_MARHT|nr:ABC transporter permease [Marinithermus hydrothermalis]AEB12653.1 ABC-type transporter, integral membrane subunit [Marinithermus hydrothermalis DSM 14884]
MARNTDERMRKPSLLRRLLGRPELGSAAGVVLVFSIFAVIAGDRGFLSWLGTVNYLEVSAQLGILAVAVSLLMIAGEFDLSIGSMIGVAGMAIAIPVKLFGWPVWAGVLLAFALALAVGYFNGWLVIRTGLPSFIVTLAALFILRGLTIGVTRLLTHRTIVSGLHPAIQEDPIAPIFTAAPFGVPAAVFWWLGLTAIGAWVLFRTAFGNWIFGAGGDAQAARNVGVPVARVKITLFMGTSFSAALLATLQVLDAGSADVLRGQLKEFEAIIASVIGGNLLTGGYGSVIGASLGALIFGMVRQGFFFTGIDTDWFQVFLGAVLLVAVMFNNYVRKRAVEAR